MEKSYTDAKLFSDILLKTKLSDSLNIGSFKLDYAKGVLGKTILSKNYGLHINLLEKMHDYTFPIMDGNLEISLELCSSGKTSQIDHPIPVQIDHQFRSKLTTTFQFKLTT